MSSDQLNIKEKPPSLTTHEARWGSSALHLLSITWRRSLADRLGEASALREAFWWTCRTWLLGWHQDLVRCLEHVGDTHFKRDWLAPGSFWNRNHTWIYLPCATPYYDFSCDIKLRYGGPPFIQLDWHFSLSTWGKAPESTWVGGSKGRVLLAKHQWSMLEVKVMKKIHSRHKRRSKMRTKIMTYCDCNGWWFRGNLLAKKRTALAFCFSTRRRKLQHPRPKRSLSCFATKIGVVSPMTAAHWLGFFLDPPRSLSSSMEDRTYGILELLSLQGQLNLQADLITWFDIDSLFQLKWVQESLKIFVIIMYIDILDYVVLPKGKREKQRSKHVAANWKQLDSLTQSTFSACAMGKPLAASSPMLQVSTKAVNAIRTVTAVASCHPNFHDTFLYCISGYIKMWHPTIKRQVGLDSIHLGAQKHSGLWLQNGGDLWRCRGAAQVGDLCLSGSTGWGQWGRRCPFKAPICWRGQMSILRVFLGVALTSDFFFFKRNFLVCLCAICHTLSCHRRRNRPDLEKGISLAVPRTAT